MQSSERLRGIPVIMMSSDNEKDKVAQCLQLGAKDYLVKPLRIETVKSIADYVFKNQNKSSTEANPTEKYQYKRIKSIGQGGNGSVDLVERTSDGQLFALKIIPLHFLSAQEKKLAESEVTLLKVLVAPTIIRYYESFNEDDQICILMEYARGGSLFDKIMEYKRKGEYMNEK